MNSLAIQRHNQQSPVTVLISGGIDSCACAALLQNQGHAVRGVFVDYGQAAVNAEEAAVKRITELMEIPLLRIVAKGQKTYEQGEHIGRNTFLISAAFFLAGITSGTLAMGIHAGTPYYDCSETLSHKLENLLKLKQMAV